MATRLEKVVADDLMLVTWQIDEIRSPVSQDSRPVN